MKRMETHAQLLRLKRFTTPTLSNTVETYEESLGLEGFNQDETRDFMPHLGPMVGYAVTATYCASRRATKMKHRTEDLLRAIEAAPKPVIVVIRDADSPRRIVGAPWGECFANICQGLGAVGTITDGAIRDYPEMLNTGFHALARRLCVSHAFGRMIEVGKPVEVFGTVVRPGDILHADQHGFLIIPPACLPTLAERTVRLDKAEIDHIITPARAPGFTVAAHLAGKGAFVQAVQAARGEWAK